MSFLKAEWRKLAIANYEVDPKLLESYIPYGTELDLWQGKCFLSLVGFKFVNTKILGIRVPFHTDFEEVNLRFYVKRYEDNQWKRGVVFIKEIVPKFALSLVANMVYNENYETLKMSHRWEETSNNRTVEYKWRKEGNWQSFKILAACKETNIPQFSETEFITEHYWGYAKVNQTTTNEYEVTHPKWKQYKVMYYQIQVDFGLTYGPSFEFLNLEDPSSVMLAEGSEITVEPKKKIK